jgi:hypothetical protein
MTPEQRVTSPGDRGHRSHGSGPGTQQGRPLALDWTTSAIPQALLKGRWGAQVNLEQHVPSGCQLYRCHYLLRYLDFTMCLSLGLIWK